VKPEVPPPLSNVEQDRSAIDQLLNEYIAAYSRMDEGRIRAIDPSFQQIQGRALIKSVTLVLPQRSITVSPDGQSAVLTATGSFNYVWNRSGFPPSSPTKLTWNLRKQGTTWTVVR
jgi:hypothetical protein